MAQQHLDRLSAVDASFLHQEGPTSHMHVGGLAIFAGPPPTMEDLCDQVRGRLHLVPRYRQKLAHTALDSGRPVWIDDASFNLEYHLRHTALPAPGNREQLLRLLSRVVSQQLDRSKPLWEIWFIEGLDDNRFALLWKTHHSVIDGIAGVDLATVLFDLTPIPPEIPNSGEPWLPHSEPGTAGLLAAGLRGAVNAGAAVTAGALDAALHPERAVATLREAVEGIAEVAWIILNPAPSTPLNVEIGPHRRFVGVSCALADFKLIKNAFGGTVNDVVLSVVSGALRTWLHGRGVRTEGLELRALVPVSVRAHHERGEIGNRIAVMRGPLPVYVEDPLARLGVVAEAMRGLKESKQALGAEVIAGVQDFAPPTILAQASRINFSTRLFNLIVTNVPGPQFPLYVLGHELEEVFPIAFLPRDHALAIAIMSYNGALNFGLLGDFDALPDIDMIGDAIAAEKDALVALARAQAQVDGGVTDEPKPRAHVQADGSPTAKPKPRARAAQADGNATAKPKPRARAAQADGNATAKPKPRARTAQADGNATAKPKPRARAAQADGAADKPKPRARRPKGQPAE